MQVVFIYVLIKQKNDLDFDLDDLDHDKLKRLRCERDSGKMSKKTKQISNKSQIILYKKIHR
jgi:hypothetical protein